VARCNYRERNRNSPSHCALKDAHEFCASHLLKAILVRDFADRTMHLPEKLARKSNVEAIRLPEKMELWKSRMFTKRR
jgi:hypothetical protein